MSDTTSPTPTSAPASPPEIPNPQQPKAGNGIGCLGIIILVCVIAWISDMAGCNKEDNSVQQQILKEMGPDNPMAKRINSLNQNNAYMAGAADGAQEAANASVRMHWTPDDYQEKLTDLRDLKSQAFDILATQNKFDSAVFDQYRHGWDYGASTLSVRMN